MTHKQPAAFGSPVFRICGATPLPNPVRRPRSRQSSGRRHSPARAPTTAAAPPDLRPPPQPRQISGRREACPPARRPRRELRSAHRLEARPGAAGLASASDRAARGAPYRSPNPKLSLQYAMRFSTMCILNNHEPFRLIRSPTTGEHHEEKPESSSDGCWFSSCRCRYGINVCAAKRTSRCPALPPLTIRLINKHDGVQYQPCDHDLSRYRRTEYSDHCAYGRPRGRNPRCGCTGTLPA